MNREIESLDVNIIELLPGRRPIDEKSVVRLTDSIKRIGLRTPLSVRILDNFKISNGEISDGVPVLVSGAHRLEAVRRLGFERVECFVLADETEAQVRLWEIAENLHRAELTELERDTHLAEWIRLTEQEDAEKASVESSKKRSSGKKVAQSAPLKKPGAGRGSKGGVRAAAQPKKAKLNLAQSAPKSKTAPRPLRTFNEVAGTLRPRWIRRFRECRQAPPQ